MSLFSAFSPLNGGTLDTYLYPAEYPYDLDAGLDFMRPKTGDTLFPFPVTTGYIDGLVPLFNNLEYALMKGRNPFGPMIGAQSAPNQVIFPNVMGSMLKVDG